MKRYLVTLILVIVTFALSAQQLDSIALDFRQIKSEIRKKDSDSYYPKLLNRYLSHDTTLTTNQLKNLYYGYIYQEDYDPYRSRDYHIADIQELYEKDTHTYEECNTIIEYAERVLADFPFDFRQMKLISYAYQTQGNAEAANLWDVKLQHLFNMILATGDGLSPNTAWYVIEPKHEFDIIYRIGKHPTNYLFVEPFYDYIYIEEADDNCEGYYFNVEKIITEFHKKSK